MIVKYRVMVCDEAGCQSVSDHRKTNRRGAKDGAKADGWQLFTDARKKERSFCPDHHRRRE